MTESEIIDGEQEKWLNGANNKENNPYEQAKNKQTASLCIKGGVSSVKQLKLVNFLIQHGVPQNFALNGRLDEGDCDFFVDNLEINYCAELVRKLNGLDFEGQKLKCTGIIESMLDSREELSNQSQLGEIKRSNSRQHVNKEHTALDMYDHEIEKESSNLRASETDNDNDSSNQVLNDSNLPFMTKIKNRGNIFMKQLKLKKSEKKYLYINNEEETNSIDKENKETNIDNVELEAKNETLKAIIENEEQNTSKKITRRSR